ncbi:MAG: phosphonate C-P lyase system protein PhnG [bacterium]|nr:phosphonate C-P lyase system protein PhnG [bacterium]
MNPFSQSEYLTLLTHAPAETVKALAESILPLVGAVEVLKNQTGLVMLPYTDTAGGVTFHLGEVLVSEAHLVIENGTQGYALVTGRDLVLAVGIAVLDAALQAGIGMDVIVPFLENAKAEQAAADHALLTQIEATRVEMETF